MEAINSLPHPLYAGRGGGAATAGHSSASLIDWGVRAPRFGGCWPLDHSPHHYGDTMFSVRQKREIADAVQRILRDTEHPELPTGEIQFQLHVDGAESWSWADIRNNGAVDQPGVNLWNESQDPLTTETRP
jgi:hypothetical protein